MTELYLDIEGFCNSAYIAAFGLAKTRKDLNFGTIELSWERLLEELDETEREIRIKRGAYKVPQKEDIVYQGTMYFKDRSITCTKGGSLTLSFSITEKKYYNLPLKESNKK